MGVAVQQGHRAGRGGEAAKWASRPPPPTTIVGSFVWGSGGKKTEQRYAQGFRLGARGALPEPR